MTDRWRIWSAIALVAAFGIAGGLLLYPVVTPEDDAGLARSLILRISTMFVGFIFLLAAVLAFDRVTPNDWLSDIEKHPMAEAVVVATLMLSLALIFIYS
jgi:uncharacterized membrane protein YjfL (UPF0719 family)